MVSKSGAIYWFQCGDLSCDDEYIGKPKFNLPHIWDRVLLNTPGLKLKRHVHTVGHANSNIPNTPN